MQSTGRVHRVPAARTRAIALDALRRARTAVDAGLAEAENSAARARDDLLPTQSIASDPRRALVARSWAQESGHPWRKSLPALDDDVASRSAAGRAAPSRRRSTLGMYSSACRVPSRQKMQRCRTADVVVAACRRSPRQEVCVDMVPAERRRPSSATRRAGRRRRAAVDWTASICAATIRGEGRNRPAPAVQFVRRRCARRYRSSVRAAARRWRRRGRGRGSTTRPRLRSCRYTIRGVLASPAARARRHGDGGACADRDSLARGSRRSPTGVSAAMRRTLAPEYLHCGVRAAAASTARRAHTRRAAPAARSDGVARAADRIDALTRPTCRRARGGRRRRGHLTILCRARARARRTSAPRCR